MLSHRISDRIVLNLSDDNLWIISEEDDKNHYGEVILTDSEIKKISMITRQKPVKHS